MPCSEAQRHLEAEEGWESGPPPFKFSCLPSNSPSLLVVMTTKCLEDAFNDDADEIDAYSEQLRVLHSCFFLSAGQKS